MNTLTNKFSLLLVFVLMLTNIASATKWIAGTGDWFNNSNWDNNRPGMYKQAYIGRGTAQINWNDAYCEDLYLSGNFSGSSTVHITGGTLSG